MVAVGNMYTEIKEKSYGFIFTQNFHVLASSLDMLNYCHCPRSKSRKSEGSPVGISVKIPLRMSHKPHPSN